MKKQTLSIIIGAAMCFALVSATRAQTPDGSVLYTPSGDLTAGNQNNFTGIVGGVFLTTYSYWPSINYLGYYDPNGAALAESHTITLWSDGGASGSSGAVVASAIIPAGTPTLWANGYAWVALPSTVGLYYGSWYQIGATVTGGVDTWGDLIANNSPDNGNNGQITWNTVNGSWSGDVNGPYVQAGSGWEGTRAGIYDGNIGDAGNPNPSFGQTSANDSIYPAANMGYNLTFTPVPEPASISLVGGGLAAVLFMRRRKR